MSGEFIQLHTAQQVPGRGSALSGLIVGRVISNCDLKHLGRVQVRLAVEGGIEIWARVIAKSKEDYFIPQEGDEVVVAFNQADANEAFVYGTVPNELKPPPRRGDLDPVNLRVIATPWKHEIAFNQTDKSVVITTDTGQRVTLKPDGIEIKADDQGATVIQLDASGNISVKAALKISFSAPEIELQAQSKLTLNGGMAAELRAGMVQIN